MLFPNPKAKKIEEQTNDEKLLLQEILHSQTKKIESAEVELFNHTPYSKLNTDISQKSKQ